MKEKHKFRIVPADGSRINHLFRLNEAELASLGAVRMIVDKKPGYPCRLSLQDADIGEEVLLFPYEHHAAASPYRASGPVFVRKNVQAANPGINEIPAMLHHRLLSLRAYDARAMMLEARVVQGVNLREEIGNILEDERVAYIHIHNAGPGCFNCQANRVD